MAEGFALTLYLKSKRMGNEAEALWSLVRSILEPSLSAQHCIGVTAAALAKKKQEMSSESRWKMGKEGSRPQTFETEKQLESS